MLWDRVWVGLTDTERLSRYYLALGDKLRRWHQRLTYLTVVFASGAVASLLAHAPELVSVVVLSLTAAVAIWSNLADYSGKAAAAHAISNRCRDLMVDWVKLWHENNQEPDPGQIDTLERLLNEITSQSPVDEDDKLHERVQEEAYAVCKAEYQL